MYKTNTKNEEKRNNFCQRNAEQIYNSIVNKKSFIIFGAPIIFSLTIWKIKINIPS